MGNLREFGVVEGVEDQHPQALPGVLSLPNNAYPKPLQPNLRPSVPGCLLTFSLTVLAENNRPYSQSLRIIQCLSAHPCLNKTAHAKMDCSMEDVQLSRMPGLGRVGNGSLMDLSRVMKLRVTVIGSQVRLSVHLMKRLKQIIRLSVEQQRKCLVISFRFFLACCSHHCLRLQNLLRLLTRHLVLVFQPSIQVGKVKHASAVELRKFLELNVSCLSFQSQT